MMTRMNRREMMTVASAAVAVPTLTSVSEASSLLNSGQNSRPCGLRVQASMEPVLVSQDGKIVDPDSEDAKLACEVSISGVNVNGALIPGDGGIYTLGSGHATVEELPNEDRVQSIFNFQLGDGPNKRVVIKSHFGSREKHDHIRLSINCELVPGGEPYAVKSTVIIERCRRGGAPIPPPRHDELKLRHPCQIVCDNITYEHSPFLCIDCNGVMLCCQDP